MIFMGSDKYPEENAYDSFVETHGGFCNAFTEGESTTYEFDIDSEHFASALDIFAHCFISPKLSDSSADREILAIDNEFHLAEMNDEARCQEVYCACCARATPNHFFSRFSWGNLHSLKEVPASLGIDTHKELRKFYETHYRPNRMKLVLISPYSMDVMYDMLSSAFGPWVDTAPTACAPSSRSSSDSGSSAALSTARGISCISTSGAISLQGFAMPFFGERPSLARFQPIKNHHRLDVYWPIDAANPAIHYRRKCAECVAHLLGHEGPGSAVSLLKKSGLITELSAGVRL
jgi:secreted Zn-dependent insulinase-like peptidase